MRTESFIILLFVNQFSFECEWHHQFMTLQSIKLERDGFVERLQNCWTPCMLGLSRPIMIIIIISNDKARKFLNYITCIAHIKLSTPHQVHQTRSDFKALYSCMYRLINSSLCLLMHKMCLADVNQQIWFSVFYQILLSVFRKPVYAFSFQHSVIHNSALAILCLAVFLWLCIILCSIFYWLLLESQHSPVLFVVDIVHVSLPTHWAVSFQKSTLLFFFPFTSTFGPCFPLSHMHCRSTDRKSRYSISLSFARFFVEFIALSFLLFHACGAVPGRILMGTTSGRISLNLILKLQQRRDFSWKIEKSINLVYRFFILNDYRVFGS